MTSHKLVTNFEIFRLHRHLLFDIRSNKDVFEIHPFSLCFYPLFYDLHNHLNVLRIFLCPWFDCFDVSICQSVVYVCKCFIKNNCQFIDLSQNMRIFITFDNHISLTQGSLNLTQSFFQLPFLQCFSCNFNQIISNFINIKIKKFF